MSAGELFGIRKRVAKGDGIFCELPSPSGTRTVSGNTFPALTCGAIEFRRFATLFWNTLRPG